MNIFPGILIPLGRVIVPLDPDRHSNIKVSCMKKEINSFYIQVSAFSTAVTGRRMISGDISHHHHL
jgi:hypothetical protein